MDSCETSLPTFRLCWSGGSIKRAYKARLVWIQMEIFNIIVKNLTFNSFGENCPKIFYTHTKLSPISLWLIMTWETLSMFTNQSNTSLSIKAQQTLPCLQQYNILTALHKFTQQSNQHLHCLNDTCLANIIYRMYINDCIHQALTPHGV